MQFACQLLFLSVSRALFNEDRAVFGLHFVRSIREDLFSHEAWDFFVGGASTVFINPDQRKPCPSWVPHEVLNSYQSLVLALPEACSSCAFEDAATWSPWISSGSVNLELPDVGSSLRLNPFEKLVITNALRPDRCAGQTLV